MTAKAKPRRYTTWAGNPNGVPEDLTRCIAEVPQGPGGILTRQCSRKRGHGPNREHCLQHGRIAFDCPQTPGAAGEVRDND